MLFVVLGGALAAGALLFMVLRDAFRVVRPRGPRAPIVVEGLVKLAALAAVCAIPASAASFTYASTGWTDPDGDGMQASLVNGRYDWMDVNGGTFGPIALAMLGAVILVTTLIVGLVRVGSRGVEQERRRVEYVIEVEG